MLNWSDETVVGLPWAADSCPWVGKLRTVLPLSDVIRDSAVQLVLTHHAVWGGVCTEGGAAVGRNQLVARAQHRDCGRAVDADRGGTRARQQTDLPRAQPVTRLAIQ